MVSSVSSPLMLVLAGLIGVLIGLLFSTLFGGNSKTDPRNVIPTKYSDEGYAEAARLLYSPATKLTITQLDGDIYNDFGALTPEQKKRVQRILQGFGTWAGQVTTSVPEPVAKSGEVPAAKVEEPTNIPVEKLPHVSPIIEEVTTPQTPAEKKSGSIVEQINDLLKEIIANSEDKNRAVTLMDNGHDGVIVWVGMEKFNGVDEVPYPEVQKLIRMAVERWEVEAAAQNRAAEAEKAE